MDRKHAKHLAAQLDAYSRKTRFGFELVRFDRGRPLKNFHRWADGKPLVSAHAVTRDDDLCLKLISIDWNESGEFYLVVFPDNASNPHAEIWSIENDNAGPRLTWTYRPRKQDDRNGARVEYFRRRFGDTTVKLALPDSYLDVPRFLGDVFALVESRARSDELDETKPETRAEFPEGAVVERLHRSRERNSGLVALVKRNALAKYGTLRGCVCGFDFRAFYGPIGEGFIEAHHIRPLSELMAGHKTKPEDLVLVCSNCHRMLHRSRPWLLPSELRALLPE